jgi:single-stranded DNA-binding protein
MSADLNHLTLSGRLARDPELCVLPSGHTVCDMLVACHYRARDVHSSSWRDTPITFLCAPSDFKLGLLVTI